MQMAFQALQGITGLAALVCFIMVVIKLSMYRSTTRSSADRRHRPVKRAGAGLSAERPALFHCHSRQSRRLDAPYELRSVAN